MITLYDIVGTIKSKRERLRGVFWALGVGCLARFLFVVIIYKNHAKKHILKKVYFLYSRRAARGRVLWLLLLSRMCSGLVGRFLGFCGGVRLQGLFLVFVILHNLGDLTLW